MPLDILKHKTILVVEDEEDLREPIAMELESHGCRVLQAPNGKAGFELAMSEKVDALISDIRMPGGDGIELLRKIRETNFADPAIFLITGQSDLSAADAYSLGAEYILAKPFNLDELTATLERILTTREERWKISAAHTGPLKAIEQEFSTLAVDIGTGNVTLGRFGIFLPATVKSPPLGSHVIFDLKFATGAISQLQGRGIVRWVRTSQSDDLAPGCGISFEYVSPAARARIIGLADEQKLQAAIPKA